MGKLRFCWIFLAFLSVSCTTQHGLRPIRPDVPWNRNAKQFIWPPVLRLDNIAKDGGSVFVYASDGSRHELISRDDVVSLEPIWGKLPIGATKVRNRTFHRAAAFAGPYGKAVLPYEQSARVAMRSVLDEPFVRGFAAKGTPDLNAYPLYRYAAKIIGSLVGGAAEQGEEGIATARVAADYLISISGKAGTPLEFMPPTYHGAKATERENDDWTMMMTPAEAGQGYLELASATGDTKYLDAAKRIADTYAKLQRPNGTWPLKVDNRTGQPVSDVELIPSEVIRFLDRLGTHQDTLDRAVKWMMENPVRTFDWKAQFDDAKVRGPYENLSKHEACMFACYLFQHRQHVELAEEIVRWAEDQFVVWEKPPDIAPRGGDERLKPQHWITPCSCEQYAMFEPISGSSAFMIVAYLRAYEATGKKLYLAKARALANALTVAQQMHNGRYPTRMIEQDLAYWINSTINTARAMQMLAKASP